LFQQPIASFIRFSNHNISGDAMVPAIPITINHSYSGASGEGRSQVARGHIVGVLDGVCACINHNLNSLD
jgi:hypothetical protein